MRIEFVTSERPGLDWPGRNLRIGSAPGCDLQLGGHGVAPEHAELSHEAGTLWLHVLQGAPRVYVNARPVRECALVRLGDTLSLGGHRLLLCADADAAQDAPPLAASGDTPVAALRAVAGPWSGRVWPIGDALELSTSGQPPLVWPEAGEASLRIERIEGGLRLRARSSSRQAPSVNGRAADESALRNGDSIGLGVHRFVVDAWALEPDPDQLRQPPQPQASRSRGVAVRPRGEVGWLILTAALLALLIALFLLLHS